MEGPVQKDCGNQGQKKPQIRIQVTSKRKRSYPGYMVDLGCEDHIHITFLMKAKARTNSSKSETMKKRLTRKAK